MLYFMCECVRVCTRNVLVPFVTCNISFRHCQAQHAFDQGANKCSDCVLLRHARVLVGTVLGLKMTFTLECLVLLMIHVLLHAIVIVLVVAAVLASVNVGIIAFGHDVGSEN
jgi:hypothetical protein